MIKLQDLSELGYGGLVTGLAAWDVKRLEEATYLEKEVYKSAKFWGFVAPGVASTVMNVIGKPRGSEPITERLMHGFIFGFPSFIKETIEAVRVEGGGTRAKGGAVADAQRLLAQQQAAAQSRAKQLAAAQGAGVSNTGIYIEEQEILA